MVNKKPLRSRQPCQNSLARAKFGNLLANLLGLGPFFKGGLQARTRSRLDEATTVLLFAAVRVVDDLHVDVLGQTIHRQSGTRPGRDSLAGSTASLGRAFSFVAMISPDSGWLRSGLADLALSFSSKVLDACLVGFQRPHHYWTSTQASISSCHQ